MKSGLLKAWQLRSTVGSRAVQLRGTVGSRAERLLSTVGLRVEQLREQLRERRRRANESALVFDHDLDDDAREAFDRLLSPSTAATAPTPFRSCTLPTRAPPLRTTVPAVRERSSSTHGASN